MIPQPIRSGFRNQGEAWTHWWLFAGRLGDTAIEAFLDREDAHRYYGGPGMPYAHVATERLTARRTLITHSGGWDI